ncbi:hypothetical protein U1Q18_052798 [Sarracenia purpurea var. burkii]
MSTSRFFVLIIRLSILMVAFVLIQSLKVSYSRRVVHALLNKMELRYEKIVLDIACSILFTMPVPKPFWSQAVLTATYLIIVCLLVTFNSKPLWNFFTRLHLSLHFHLGYSGVLVLFMNLNTQVEKWILRLLSVF